MNVVFFTLYIVLILLIIEMSTMLLQATGLRREVAKFQAISLLTGTGYTTSESELIIDHPLRRRIASFLIIFGTISFAVILSFVISFFVTTVVHLADLGIGLVLLVCALFLLRMPMLRRAFLRQIGKRVRQAPSSYLPVEGTVLLESGYSLRQFRITPAHSHIVHAALKELDLAQQNVKIMSIKRNGETIQHPTGSTTIQPGDIVLVYGHADAIRKFFILSEDSTNKEGQ
ncbi:TrkA C-terminal domain-containing protein [Aneurinibacillus sp. BA2021]|nr:TrkA C-terminal domain-containing protein [Aneurinibacillus sp. BA2021]